MSDHGNPTSDRVLYEIEHILLILMEQLEVDLGLLEGTIPGEGREGDIPGRIKLKMLQRDLTKSFKDISEEEDIGFQVEIVILSHVLDVEGFPDILSVLVIFG